MRCLLVKSVLHAVAGLSLLGGCASQKPAPKAYTFWPAAPAEPRVQFLVAYRSSKDVTQREGGGLGELIMGKEPESDLPILNPYGVAAWNGRIYVTDLKGKGVLVLDIKERATRVMGLTGSGALERAVDIAIAPDGSKYVADQNKNQIVVFDADERYQRSFLGQITPIGLAIDGDELYVTDHASNTIKVLNRFNGQLLRTFGKAELVRPLSIAIDPRGFVLVSDVIRARVCRFTKDGKFVSAFGQPGNRFGDFTRPKHMKVTKDGTVFVVDAQFANVQVFDEDGRPMGFFGLSGRHPGSMSLPAGLALIEDNLELYDQYVHPAFAPERLVVVTNQLNSNKVSVYAIGQLKPGHSLSEINNAQRFQITSGLEKPGQANPTALPTGTTLPAEPPTIAPERPTTRESR